MGCVPFRLTGGKGREAKGLFGLVMNVALVYDGAQCGWAQRVAGRDDPNGVVGESNRYPIIG